ncbi:MAG: histidine phosphatase family protein [Sneathiella sp.]|nr:histidine phosphatase family protein [Sneathiella sp.]
MADVRKQEWWLIRHAPVRLNTLYGQRDVDADFSEDQKFERLASLLPDAGRVVCSDLKRCIKTAEKTLPDRPLHREPAFREQHFGDWQGLTYDQVEENDPSGYTQFWEDPITHSPPNGESFRDLVTRSVAARKDVSLHHPVDTILLFAHAGPIRALLAEALDIPLDRVLSLVIDPLSHSKLTLFTSDSQENWQENWQESWQVDWINRSGP